MNFNRFQKHFNFYFCDFQAIFELYSGEKDLVEDLTLVKEVGNPFISKRCKITHIFL